MKLTYQNEERLEQNRIFNAASSFDLFSNAKYYQNEPKFNDVYSRNNLFKITDGAYVIINLDEYKSIGTYWIVLHVNDDNVTYFDSFGVEYISKEIKKLISNKTLRQISIE